jgi:hypothetical protein
LSAELAWRAVPTHDSLRRGQLEVRTSDESWLAGGTLTAASCGGCWLSSARATCHV